VEAAENLERGLDSLPPPSNLEPESIARLRTGLVETERSFVGLLERNGIRKEDPTGSAFDPNLHQTVSEQESTGCAPGIVLRALTPSWTLNGRLLRPAMVVVSRAPTMEPSSSSPRLNQTV